MKLSYQKILPLTIYLSSLFLLFSQCRPAPKPAVTEQLQAQQYLFFLHNRFLETHGLDAAHPQYGKVEYLEILASFRAAGFEVISEQRQGDVNVQTYAQQLVRQIDTLLENGTAPQNITVVGTSKGGYIAQYVSTFLAHPQVNYVFIGSYQDTDMVEFPDINFCGNILNIYEISDPYSVSAQARADASALQVSNYKDVALQTGLRHGFLFKALDEWIQPCVDWANEHSVASESAAK
ncbi:MAG: alpha/beta hydrolase [Bacteroidota bacterium]